MSGASELSRDTLIDFLTGRGFDRDVLTNFCSDSWLLEIAERQLFANPDEEEEQESDEFVWVMEPPKEDQRDKIAAEVERFLSEGGEVDELDSLDIDEPGEAGSSWAKEIRVDD